MMGRRMSCALTIDAVRARRKTVTRRAVDTWQALAVGDRLTLIEKGMGLPKGARQVVLAEVEVTGVRVEPISAVTWDEIVLEGFHPARWTPERWVSWWLSEHGYRPGDDPVVRRIEWRYPDVDLLGALEVSILRAKAARLERERGEA